MFYVGIDLHRRTAVVAIMDEGGKVVRPRTFQCNKPRKIVEYISGHQPFIAVIEATAAYRWLYDLLTPHGDVVLAHPLRLKSIWSNRAKTDNKDAIELADLLRIGRIPESYVPEERYQGLRDITRERSRLVRARTEATNSLHSILWRANTECPYKSIAGKKALLWLEALELPAHLAIMRDERVERVRYFEHAIERIDQQITTLADEFPEVEAIIGICGIGLYSALLIVGEFGEVERFSNSSQAGAYAGLTPRVMQSGQTDKRGRISKDGSRYLRWVLVIAAMQVTRADVRLKNFYTRVRKRSGKMRARTAVARKLAEICWIRLRNWWRENKVA